MIPKKMFLSLAILALNTTTTASATLVGSGSPERGSTRRRHRTAHPQGWAATSAIVI